MEDLKKKREELHTQILAEEEEKLKVQNDLHILTERLARITENLNKKIATRNEYDRTISETESAYMKVRACALCLPACSFVCVCVCVCACVCVEWKTGGQNMLC